MALRRLLRTIAPDSAHIRIGSRAVQPSRPRSLRRQSMQPARRRAIFRRLQEANPHPTTELLNDSPFELLVAVMLSAHTTDKSVNGATRKLFPVANTPAAIAKLGVDGVKPYIKTVGLYNTKAQNLIGLAQQIVDKHGGEVPASRDALEALPGVGRK